MKKADLNSPELLRSSIYNNGDVAIVDNFKEIDIEGSIYKTDVYFVVVCRKGRASLHINGVPHIVHENDLFVCPPNVILENGLLSLDFECCCISMSINYLQKIMPMVYSNWDISLFFEKTPLISLNTDEVSALMLYYDLLCSRLKNASEEHFKKIIDALMVVFLYEFQIITSRVAKINPRPFTSKEQHFKSFIELLSSAYPKNRQVSYYADRLCITPKYLSTVCKEVGGQPASKIIDQLVAQDIEYLLKHTRKTIKEIVNELNFPNVSFFGKYVKNTLGASPKALRKKMVDDEQS